MTYVPPPTTEPRDTIPAPPPWEGAAEFTEDGQITTPDVPPWFNDAVWDDAWPDVPTLVTAQDVFGPPLPH